MSDEKRDYRPVPHIEDQQRFVLLISSDPEDRYNAVLDLAMRGQDLDEILFWIGHLLNDPDPKPRYGAMFSCRHLFARWQGEGVSAVGILTVLEKAAKKASDEHERQTARDTIDNVTHLSQLSE